MRQPSVTSATFDVIGNAPEEEVVFSATPDADSVQTRFAVATPGP